MFPSSSSVRKTLALWLTIAALIASPSALFAVEISAEAITRALAEAGDNRPQLESALSQVSGLQRESMRFLVAHMPPEDLRTLSSAYLIDNVASACRAYEQAPWRDQIPKAVFLNDVLPYASVNESRDVWREKVRALAAPMVAGCRSPGEAAQRINEQLFKLTGVHYSTSRRRPDQGPLETLETKVATCTGLSILLVDACRSVGVPARVAGTPLWFNKRGNHTWVEVWDGGWHFVGAAEPDPQGLDRGWFTHDASQALKDVPEHAIYASSFERTGVSFPMVWARDLKTVPAVNVTERYTPKATTPVDARMVRLLVKVLNQPGGQRVPAKVSVQSEDGSGVRMEGLSRGETADLNDILPFQIAAGQKVRIQVEGEGRVVKREWQAGTNAQQVVVIPLQETLSYAMASQACYVRPAVKQEPKPAVASELDRAFDGYFAASKADQSRWKFPSRLERLLESNEPAVRRAAWLAWQRSPIHAARKADFEAHRVRSENHESPYTVKEVGTKPAGGWPLFIAMHGGGGVPKQVNDSQWKHMQIYYKDHPELGGYLYVALRAPNDTWNGFYDTYVYPLIANLVQQFSLFGEVDPNKVFIMGYSHGGYGAYAIGPKIPDRFAAIHASAAAATEGETTPVTLRNTRFSAMVGEKDVQYGRYERNLKFRDAIDALRGDRKDIYPVTVQVIAGNGHTGLPDRDKIVDMYPSVRNPIPSELSWLMTDEVVADFFWLRCDKPTKGLRLDARLDKNQLTLNLPEKAAAVEVFADSRTLNFTKPLTVSVNGKPASKISIRPHLKVLCETLQRRGDPDLAFSGGIRIASGKVVPLR